MADVEQSPVIEAAGAVIERAGPEGPSVALIYRERYGPEWALPKGKRAQGETWQQAARREVEEETGLRPRFVGVAGATAYMAGGSPKVVLYFHMRMEGAVPTFVPNDEVRKLAWLSVDQAMTQLAHPEEATVLRLLFNRPQPT